MLKVSAAWSRQRNGYVGLDGGDPDNLGQNLGPAAFAVPAARSTPGCLA
ncbi:hypothetical protein WJ968_31135 [Achromobacter xylosoxidans]